MSRNALSAILIVVLIVLLFSWFYIAEEKEKHSNEQQEHKKAIARLEYQLEVVKSNLELKSKVVSDLKAENARIWDVLRMTNDYHLLLKAVASEGQDEPYACRQYITATILNRVKDKGFENTIYDVIHEPGQFDVVDNGSIYRVKASDSTVEAVESVIKNELITNILYFMNPKLSGEFSRSWMRTKAFVVKSGKTEFYAEHGGD